MKSHLKTAVVLALVAAAVVAPAFAGTDTTFGSINTLVMGWLGGSLGKLLAGIFVIIGLVAGAARQSLLAFAVGIGAAVGIANIEIILGNIVTATLSNAPSASQAVLTIANGLN